MTDVLTTEVLADDAPFNGLVGQRLLRKEDPKLVPAASDVPAVFTDHTVTPSPSKPMGVKGVGEAGTIGAAAAVINAIVDALSHLGVRDVPMPASPNRVWAAIQTARA